MDEISFRSQSFPNLELFVSVEKVLRDNCKYSYVVAYDKDMACDLSALCDKYGSDKGEINSEGHPYKWRSHSYADFLSDQFGHHRNLVGKVFECGIGTNNPNLASSMGSEGKPGASLRVWRDYFPNAMVYGADIDRDILFEEERIKTFFVDQTSPESVSAMWAQIGVDNLDLMIDDGLHTFEAGVCLFENSISKLSCSGDYIIEDVNSFDMLRYRNYFWGKSYRVRYVTLHRPNVPLSDNQLVVIRRL